MSIEEWLKHPKPSYQAGINLLKQNGENAAYIQLLELGITDVNVKMMRSRLQLALENAAKVASSKVATLEDIPIKDQVAAVAGDDESTYRLIKHINKEAFRKAANRYNFMCREDISREDRYQAAKFIIQTFDDTISKTMRDIKQYEQDGTLPADHFLSVKDVPDNRQDALREILNLRSRISKNKKNPLKEADVYRWRMRIEELKKELNAAQAK